MADQRWETTRTPFLVVGLLLSAFMFLASALPIRAAFAGRTVFLDSRGNELDLASRGTQTYVTVEHLSRIPEPQRSSYGTFRHDASVQWHHLCFGLLTALLAGCASIGSALELIRRRRKRST